jgi:hypothetical protein
VGKSGFSFFITWLLAEIPLYITEVGRHKFDEKIARIF